MGWARHTKQMSLPSRLFSPAQERGTKREQRYLYLSWIQNLADHLMSVGAGGWNKQDKTWFWPCFVGMAWFCLTSSIFLQGDESEQGNDFSLSGGDWKLSGWLTSITVSSNGKYAQAWFAADFKPWVSTQEFPLIFFPSGFVFHPLIKSPQRARRFGIDNIALNHISFRIFGSSCY